MNDNNFKRKDNNQSDDETDGYFDIPRGVLKTGSGWKGEELELDRDRTTRINPNNNNNVPVAVDLKQFHNVGIGIGYQAKHVIRQPSTKTSEQRQQQQQQQQQQGSDPVRRVNSGPTTTSSNSTGTILKEIIQDDDELYTKKRKISIKSNENSERLVLPRSITKYLKCEAFRSFCKEIEQIVET